MIQAHSKKKKKKKKTCKGYRFTVELRLGYDTPVEMGCQAVSFNVDSKQTRMVRVLQEDVATRWPSIKTGKGTFSVMLQTSVGETTKAIRYNYHDVEYVPIWQGLDASADDFVEEALIFYGVTPQ